MNTGENQDNTDTLEEEYLKECPECHHMAMKVINSISGKAPDGQTDMDVDLLSCTNCGCQDSE